MKLSTFKIFCVISLASLLALQGMWLHYAYQNENTKIRIILNESLLKAIEEEMTNRFSSYEKEKILEDYEESASPSSIYEYKYDHAQGDLISQQFGFIQQILFYESVYFNLAIADSIYASFLHQNNINVQYRISYMDSLGNSIESIGADIDKGLTTNIIPIVNGTKVGAIVKILPPTIFQSMLGILIVSILIFFLIIACFVSEVKIFFTQNHLHQLREDFVQTFSHNMKTPLATIHSVLVQLNNGSLDAEPEIKRKFNRIATDQTINLQVIVNQILTTAYMNKKQLCLSKQEIDLPQMVHSLINQFMVKKEKDIEFSEKYNLGDKLIFADFFYLKNAVCNLIENAIKYSGNAVKIDIECIARNKQISIHVKDNGFGISEKDQQKVFYPFERGAEIKRKQISGFGLGLNYVKCVVEAHGGLVTLVSKESVGSEFTVIIPLT